MGKLMKTVCSHENLNLAWKTSCKDRAHWVPGTSRREIQRDLYGELLRLAEELRSGRYRTADVRRLSIKKASGGERQIALLALRDKVAQRAVMQVLQPEFERQFHSDSFGYRPGRNVAMAHARARTYITEQGGWVVHTDIKDCFDRIPIRRLLKVLKRWIKDPRCAALVKRWLYLHATTGPGWFRRARGVPQGAILSSLWVNAYLTELDVALENEKVRFVRYADDILLVCKSRKEAKRHARRLARHLKRMGLAMNKRKTQVSEAGRGVQFLGEPLPKPRKRGV